MGSQYRMNATVLLCNCNTNIHNHQILARVSKKSARREAISKKTMVDGKMKDENGLSHHENKPI